MANGTAEPNGAWHLDKRVSWGHILMTTAMVASFSIWLVSLDGKIGHNADEIEEIRVQDHRHAQDEKEMRRALEVRMEAQTRRIEGRMEAQYNEIIRRLEILDSRLAQHQQTTGDT